ncbi:unnamed protein product [Zymoseptoria tritici ST99CH_1A5]|uniref:Uncharacterized protein n=1 Tax=Zymoseptoria tritici ST99CH_1A5 TaxID=1276529 RepID=A0A1Y6LRZ2_ZYMTR|nr:unnamed protein product [Zymoseptoria tritici ST99CH_1A5]
MLRDVPANVASGNGHSNTLIRDLLLGDPPNVSTANCGASRVVIAVALCKAQAASLECLLATWERERTFVLQSRPPQSPYTTELLHFDDADDTIALSAMYHAAFAEVLSTEPSLPADFDETLATLRHIHQSLATACSTLHWRLLYLQGQLTSSNQSRDEQA